jgi:manganese/iron transport system ATP-binding protein
VVRDVTLTIWQGELVALVGPNGAGKSTLLKLLVGLIRPYVGAVRVQGAAPEAARARIAYLPQAESLRWDFPLRVADVVRMGTVGRGRSRDGAAVRDALARVDAARLADRPVDALSGGERQRVLLARALVADPEVYLLDEPATAVDPTSEEELMTLLGALSSQGRTLVVATHDLAGVLAHFPRVICLNGEVIADGGTEVLRDDAILRATYGGHRPGRVDLVMDEHHA